MENNLEKTNTKENIEKETKAKNKKYKTLIPKLDIVFQCLFGKNNPKITKSFVQALLDEEIKSIKINEDKELIRQRPEDKLGILDLQLDVNNNEKIDVEIQLLDKDNFIERLLFYITKMYSNQIKKGDDYKEAKRVVLVAIIDFEIKVMKELNKMESKWKLIETENRQKILTDLIEIDIISLKKANEEYSRNKNNIKAQWMLFLNDPESKEVQAIMKENEDIKEATITVNEMSEDEKMQRLADLRLKAIMDEKAIKRLGFKEGMKKGIEDGMAKGMSKGMSKGMLEGEKNAKLSMIKNLNAINMPIEQIASVVEMNVEEVKKVLNTKN